MNQALNVDSHEDSRMEESYHLEKEIAINKEGKYNTPFTPFDAKSVNEMSLAFKTLLQNFHVNFFFKHYLNIQNSFLN